METTQGGTLPVARQCHARRNIIKRKGIDAVDSKDPATYEIKDSFSLKGFVGNISMRVDRISGAGAWKVDLYTSMCGEEIQTHAPVYSFEGTDTGEIATLYSPETFALIAHVDALEDGVIDLYITLS